VWGSRSGESGVSIIIIIIIIIHWDVVQVVSGGILPGFLAAKQRDNIKKGNVSSLPYVNNLFQGESDRWPETKGTYET
jgi:hypothetical protein